MQSGRHGQIKRVDVRKTRIYGRRRAHNCSRRT